MSQPYSTRSAGKTKKVRAVVSLQNLAMSILITLPRPKITTNQNARLSEVMTSVGRIDTLLIVDQYFVAIGG